MHGDAARRSSRSPGGWGRQGWTTAHVVGTDDCRSCGKRWRRHGGMRCRSVRKKLTRSRLRIAAHDQLVAAHFPAFQPVEEAHAEQAGAQLSGLRDQRRHRALDQAADADAVERDRRPRGSCRWRYRRRRCSSALPAAAPRPWRPPGSARRRSRRCRAPSATVPPLTCVVTSNSPAAAARDLDDATARRGAAGHQFGHHPVIDAAQARSDRCSRARAASAITTQISTMLQRACDAFAKHHERRCRRETPAARSSPHSEAKSSVDSAGDTGIVLVPHQQHDQRQRESPISRSQKQRCCARRRYLQGCARIAACMPAAASAIGRQRRHDAPPLAPGHKRTSPRFPRSCGRSRGTASSRVPARRS